MALHQRALQERSHRGWLGCRDVGGQEDIERLTGVVEAIEGARRSASSGHRCGRRPTRQPDDEGEDEKGAPARPPGGGEEGSAGGAARPIRAGSSGISVHQRPPSAAIEPEAPATGHGGNLPLRVGLAPPSGQLAVEDLTADQSGTEVVTSCRRPRLRHLRRRTPRRLRRSRRWRRAPSPTTTWTAGGPGPCARSRARRRRG